MVADGLRAVCALLAAAVLAPWRAAEAQFDPEGNGRWQFESRVDGLIAETTAIHGGVGANVVTGTYLRVGLLGAAGVRNVGRAWDASGRLDAFARFHVDPFRQFGGAVYVAGGATVLFDRGADPRIRGMIALGVEARPWGDRWIPGVEVGIGGGVRVGGTLRRARRGAR